MNCTTLRPFPSCLLDICIHSTIRAPECGKIYLTNAWPSHCTEKRTILLHVLHSRRFPLSIRILKLFSCSHASVWSLPSFVSLFSMVVGTLLLFLQVRPRLLLIGNVCACFSLLFVLLCAGLVFSHILVVSFILPSFASHGFCLGREIWVYRNSTHRPTFDDQLTPTRTRNSKK